MELGMYTPEIRREGIGELFRAISGYGFTLAQLDFESVCGERMPERLSAAQLREVEREAGRSGVAIAAVNGTFNMIHPDLEVRREGMRRFETIARASSELGSRLVTLCTGTRSRESMWARHEGNSAPAAWSDLKECLAPLIEIAERHDIDLGIECEASNVVTSAELARRLLDEMRAPRLKVIMDAANLFAPSEARVENVRPVLRRAFELLGSEIALAHGKDLLAGPGLSFTSAGRGIVDFDYLLALLREQGYAGGMILHGMKSEEEFPPAVDYLRERIAPE